MARLRHPDDRVQRSESDLKPVVFPEGFVLVVDTREQTPLFDDNHCPDGLTFVRATLHKGDYSIKGFEDQFAIERKQVSDFYSYIGNERTNKTIPKMEEFRDMVRAGGWVALIIECTEDHLLFGAHYTQMTPQQARAALVSFRSRYGVHVYFHNQRSFLRRFVLDHAVKFWNLKREV